MPPPLNPLALTPARPLAGAVPAAVGSTPGLDPISASEWLAALGGQANS